MNTNFFNLTKKQKRDLLFELLSGKSSEGIISKKELNALNRLIETTPSNRASLKVANQPLKQKKTTAVKKKVKAAKVKTTHYVSQEISEDLDRAQKTIRSLAPEHLKADISKSFIVNHALALLLEEFKEKGKNSKLMRHILQDT